AEGLCHGQPVLTGSKTAAQSEAAPEGAASLSDAADPQWGSGRVRRCRAASRLTPTRSARRRAEDAPTPASIQSNPLARAARTSVLGREATVSPPRFIVARSFALKYAIAAGPPPPTSAQSSV